MTAVMRAMSVTTGPKVIRVGVVRGGRVVEERVIKQRITITVGSSETSLFLVSAPAFPASFPLFELAGGDYYLNVLEGMKGRVALADGITDLQAIRGRRVKLTAESRGKVIIGETTLLFQFVAPPPQQARPQLPLAVKGGLATNNDWALTFIAAFSFLVHFGIVGSMYSDWSDPIVGDDHNVAGLVDMMARIPPPPATEAPDQQPNTTLPPTPPTPPTAKPDTRPTAPNTVVKHGEPSQPSNPQISNDRAAALVARAEAMEVQRVAGMNAGPAVSNALDRSNVVAVDLTSAAERNIGVGHTNGDLKPVAGGPVQTSNKAGLSGLAATKTDNTGKIAGNENAVAGPTAVAQVGAPLATIPIGGADVVVAGLRNRFRICYQTGLNGDPTMSGKVVIRASVGPNGEVTSADIASMSGLSPTVGQCIASVVKRATFNAPGGGGSTLQIPVTFVQQPAK